MSDYLPVFKPGENITLSASAAIVGGQLLVVSGSGTVAPAAAASAPGWVGVAAFDAASGVRVGVASGGVQELICTTAVVAGDLVVSSGTAGQVASVAATTATAAATAATAGDINSTRAIVGLALTSAAAGAKARIKMER